MTGRSPSAQILRSAARRAGRRLADLGRALGRKRVTVALLLGAVAVAPVLAFAAWTWRDARRVDLRRAADQVVVYAAGQTLEPGVSIAAVDLQGALRRLEYRETSRPPSAPGEFRRADGAWTIFLRARGGPETDGRPLAVRVELDGARVTRLLAEGRGLDNVSLEPEPLTGLGSTAGRLRRPVTLVQVPEHLLAAVLAIEDHRFHEHAGVDVRAVARALWVNLRRGEVQQGASTLTQQLVKNLVLTPKRVWTRKVREAAIALWLERRYAKGEILEAYLNGIYLGQHGNLSIYGIGAAAQSYFGKDVERLTVGEAALLAGLIRAPNTYSPLQHRGRSRERRDVVLRRLRELGRIDEATLARGLRESIPVRRTPPPRLLAPYFLDHVRVEAEQAQGDDGASTAGMRLYTTLDPALQRAAERAVLQGLDRLESQHRRLRRSEPGERLQAALVALDARTGEIRALVGGRDYVTSQFNRAVHARRQPGSAFKPFVYLAALSSGPRGELPPFTAVSRVEDRPITVRAGKETWSPRNYENRYEGTVTVRRALEQSLNGATVWMAEAVGLEAIVRAAREVGFTSPMAPVPALVLGSFEVTPLELARAYAPLANGGTPVASTTLRAIVDREGAVLERPAGPVKAVLGPDQVYLLTHLLAGVMDRGTGTPARALGVTGQIAGKTGTTNEGRDAWFVGYTPRLVTLVWVGFDERDAVGLSGGQAALPIWAEFVRTAAQVVPAGPFVPPPGIVVREVDPATGKLATSWCPVVVREVFLASTEPREPCADHGPGDVFRSFFRRFFGIDR